MTWDAKFVDAFSGMEDKDTEKPLGIRRATWETKQM